jgi:hypothetical protein
MKVFSAVLAAGAAVAFISTSASALSAIDGARAGDAVSSGEPSLPPTSIPTLPPTTEPTIPPLPTPTPTPSGEQCPLEPFIATNVAVRSRVMAGPVTCEHIHSVITVSWDGTNIKIVIKPVDDFANGKCELVKASVKATAPNNARVKDDGSVEVPYDKDKKEKITIKIEYDFKCTVGDLIITLKKVVTIEFTPPDGPVVIKNKNRP